MEFGKLENVDHVQWNLPTEDPLVRPFLAKLAGSTPIGQPRYYIGAPAWGHKTWIGKIYPEKTKPEDFLKHYAKYFNCVELNTTHYRIPGEEQTNKWLSQIGDDFLFCPKIFQGISHRRNGLLDQSLLTEWFTFLEKLGPHRGPCFLQLPPHFDLSEKKVLFQFLQNWPKEFELALEFRHPTWFEQGVIRPALTEYLQTKSIGLVITDVAGRRDVSHSSVSADFTLIRFIANNLHSSDFERSELWSQRLKSWNEQGIRKVFFIVHEPDDVSAPEMAKSIVQEWADLGVANLKSIEFVKSEEDRGQQKLF